MINKIVLFFLAFVLGISAQSAAATTETINLEFGTNNEAPELSVKFPVSLFVDGKLQLPSSNRRVTKLDWRSQDVYIRDGFIELRNKNFSSDFAEVLIRPRNTRINQTYMNYMEGNGLAAVNLDYFLPPVAQTGGEMAFTSTSRTFLNGDCKTSDRYVARYNKDQPDGRYIALGSPDACVSDKNAAVFMLSDVPDWMKGEAKNALAQMMDLLNGNSLERYAKPIMFLSVNLDSRWNWTGDAGPYNTMAVRFFGADWKTRDDERAKIVQDLIMHEASHFLAGKRVYQPEGAAYRWFSEGAADYLTFKLLNKVSDTKSPVLLSEVSARISSCFDALRNNALTSRESRGTPDYRCGFVGHWLMDLTGTPDDKNYVARWQCQISRLGRAEMTWQEFAEACEDFENVQPTISAFAQEESAAKRLEQVAARLAQYSLSTGARVTSDPDAIRSASVNTILYAACSNGPYGYHQLPDHLILDTKGSERCGALGSAPAVRSLGGYDLINATQDLHAYVTEQCSNGKTVVFQLLTPREDGTVDLPVECNGRVVQLPQEISITN